MSQYHCISCVHRTAHTRSLNNILHFRLKELIGRKPNKSPSHVHQVRLPCPPSCITWSPQCPTRSALQEINSHCSQQTRWNCFWAYDRRPRPTGRRDRSVEPEYSQSKQLRTFQVCGVLDGEVQAPLDISRRGFSALAHGSFGSRGHSQGHFSVRAPAVLAFEARGHPP